MHTGRVRASVPGLTPSASRSADTALETSSSLPGTERVQCGQTQSGAPTVFRSPGLSIASDDPSSADQHSPTHYHTHSNTHRAEVSLRQVLRHKVWRWREQSLTLRVSERRIHAVAHAFAGPTRSSPRVFRAPRPSSTSLSHPPPHLRTHSKMSSSIYINNFLARWQLAGLGDRHQRPIKHVQGKDLIAY